MSYQITLNTWSGSSKAEAAEKLASVFRLGNDVAVVDHLCQGMPWRFDQPIPNSQADGASTYLRSLGFAVDIQSVEGEIEPLSDAVAVEAAPQKEEAPDSFSATGKQTDINWKLYAAGILFLIFSGYGFIKIIPPFLADRMVDKIPVEWEVSMGQSILKMLPVKREPDPKVLKVLQDTVDLLEQSVAGNQPYDLKIYIWPIEQVNALALPGGPIVVFEGLLNQAESPEELAGVIAHEIQHILLRHSTRGIIRNMAQSMLLSLFIGDVNAVMEGMAALVGELETLGFSREMEAEADQKGMELILSANIDPHGMIRIFEKLMQEEPEDLPKEKTASKENDMELSSYFSTHPSGQNRLAQMEKQMKPHEDRTWAPLFPNLDWNEIKPAL